MLDPLTSMVREAAAEAAAAEAATLSNSEGEAMAAARTQLDEAASAEASEAFTAAIGAVRSESRQRAE